MKENNIIQEKTFAFAVRSVNLYKPKKRNRILRSHKNLDLSIITDVFSQF